MAQVVERVPIVVEKKYAINSKATKKSKLDDDVNAVSVSSGGGKKKKKREDKTEDFNADDYEDVIIPPPRANATPEELMLREAVVHALLAHLGTR